MSLPTYVYVEIGTAIANMVKTFLLNLGKLLNTILRPCMKKWNYIDKITNVLRYTYVVSILSSPYF
jgi:hypothetical protein